MSQFLIKNEKGQYLYYNGSLIHSGYYRKDKKQSAGVFNRRDAKKIKRYLMIHGSAKVITLKPVTKDPRAHGPKK